MENRKYVLLKQNKALFKYTVVEKYEAGIVLAGSEVKSLRMRRVSLKGAFCSFKNYELFIQGMRIDAYKNSDYVKVDILRERKLLLGKRELLRLRKKVEEKGYTIIPIKIYLSGSYVKLEIGIVTGKKKFDKREEIKKRDIERDEARMRKNK